MRFTTVSLLVTVASAAVSFAAPYLPLSSPSPGRLPAFYIPPHPFLRLSDIAPSAASQSLSQCQDIHCFISDAATKLAPLVQRLSKFFFFLLYSTLILTCRIASLSRIALLMI